MALKLMQVKANQYEADGATIVGKTFNVYDTYANALAHSSTGLITGLQELNRLTGGGGDVVTQVAKTTGFDADVHGLVNFFIDDGGGYSEVFVISEAGRQSGPIRLVVQ